MHFSTVLLTLATTVTLASASDFVSYHCLFAQDKSKFPQEAYCCDSFSDVRGTDLTKSGNNCTNMEKNVQEFCPDGNTPKCCYTIGPMIMCTSEAHAQTEAEI